MSNTSTSSGVCSNSPHNISSLSISSNESPKITKSRNLLLQGSNYHDAVMIFYKLNEEKQNEIFNEMGIREPCEFRDWLDSTSAVSGFDQFIQYLEEKAFLLGDKYYEATTVDEQLAILNLTEEACINVHAQIKEDEKTSSFPINPTLRYIRAYASEKWCKSLSALLDDTLVSCSTIESTVSSPTIVSFNVDFGSTSLESISVITIQPSLTPFSRVYTPTNNSIRCFRTKNVNVTVANTGLVNNITEQESLFYHGTIFEYASQLLEYGIPGSSPFSSSDFGPGFYLNPSFEDARDWALKRIRNSALKLGIVLIYRIDISEFNIWNLSQHEENNDDHVTSSNEWRELIRSCRKCRCPHQIIYQFDAVFGPQCANPNQMLYNGEEPRVRRLRSSIVSQLCTSSPTFKTKLYRDLLEGVVILDQRTTN